MARIRSIKPDFFYDTDLCNLTVIARLGFVGLWCHVDKAGRVEDNAKMLKAKIFPYDEIEFETILSDLEKGNFIIRYDVDGKGFIQIRTWEKHQRPHHTEHQSLIPGPDNNRVLTVNEPLLDGEKKVGKDHGSDSLIMDQGKDQGGDHGKEDKSAFAPPTISEVSEYCISRKNGIDAEKWMSHYQSNGWKVGRNKMKDWKAAIRTWERSEYGPRKNILTSEEMMKSLNS